MRIPVTLDIQAVLQDESAKVELIDELLIDSTFLGELAELLVVGFTSQSSWPCNSVLAKLREKVLLGFGAEMQAELVANAQRAEDRRDEAQRQQWDAEKKVSGLKSMVKRANPVLSNAEATEDGPVTEIKFTIQHRGNEGDSCPACHLMRFLKNAEVEYE